MRRAALVLLLGLACSKAGEEQQGTKRAPIPPPVEQGTALPVGLSIPVEVDGAAAPPVTTATLSAQTPDFADDERRAWRLSAILPAYVAGATVEAVGRDGVSMAMPRPATLEEPQPVLFVTRRGDVVAMVVDPNDPFPDFHGQGGRLRRPGDLTTRVTPIVKLRVHSHGAPP